MIHSLMLHIFEQKKLTTSEKKFVEDSNLQLQDCNAIILTTRPSGRLYKI
jgi:hypothetical protein